MRISDWSSDVCSSDLRDRRVDEPPGVDDRDQLFDLQALVALPRGRHQRDVTAAHRMARQTLRAPREAAFPAAEAGRGEQAAREQRRITQHRPAIRSEEHTSELQSLMRTSYDVFCLKKKKKNNDHIT